MERSRFDNPGYSQEHGEPFDPAAEMSRSNAERAEAERMWAAEQAARREREGVRETRVRVFWESEATIELPIGWKDGDPIPDPAKAQLGNTPRRIVRVEYDERF